MVRILHELCQQQGMALVEGHVLPDYIHLCLRIFLKYNVADTMGRLEGKSVIPIHQEFLKRKHNYTGLHCWARGYCVSVIGKGKKCQEEIQLRSPGFRKLHPGYISGSYF